MIQELLLLLLALVQINPKEEYTEANQAQSKQKVKRSRDISRRRCVYDST